ncbi:MAG: hypothetical protein ACP5NS_04235 [Candidatus Pacearchaeota archaeon]
MVHKKYTYKDGKKFGPYYYETKRVDGQVVTTYLGTELPKTKNNSKKYSIAFFSLVVLIVALLLIYNFYNLTGNVSLDLKTDYAFGEPIEGLFTLNLKAGEFIPADSEIIISYADHVSALPLSSLASSELRDGLYYAEGTSISGYGQGYGSLGTANTYPEVSFQLRLIETESTVETDSSSGADSDSSTASDGSSSSEEESSETTSESESTDASPESNAGETIPDSSEESASDSSESTGDEGSSSSESSDSSSSSDSGGITGAVTDGSSIIAGSVSGSQEFTYTLTDGGFDVELIPGSVTYNGTVLSDDSVSISISNGEVIVSTSYSIVSEGYGEEYLGDYSDEISIDLSQFGLVADLEAPFSVELVYQEKIIVSATEDISVSGSQTDLTPVDITPVLPTIEINENDVDVNLTQFDAVIGQPVKWNKRVSFDLNTSVNLFVQIPASAESIVIEKINETEYMEDNDLSLPDSEPSTDIIQNSPQNSTSVQSTTQESSQIDTVDTVDAVVNDSIILEDEPTAEVTVGVTGQIVSGHVTAKISVSKEPKVLKSIKKIFGITGRAIEGEEIISEVQELSINVSAEEFGVDLEYTTDAPVSTEEDLGDSKIIRVSGPEDVHYSNVLVFTSISDSLEITDSSELSVQWVENNSNELNIYNLSDTNEDGNYDYVAWIAPHLSNQTFHLILVERAKHLDSNYSVIDDIYHTVVALDGNWTNEINDTQIVRVSFEEKLSSDKDITIYANITQGNPIIKVYEKNENVTLAIFENINNSVLQTIYLTNLSGQQKTFDLQISGGSVIFDYIVDPIIQNLGGPITDIDMSPLDSETFAIVYVNTSSANVQFSVINTNGSTFTAPVTVFQGVNYNITRVAITSINSTAVFIGVLNGTIDSRLLYSKSGTKLAGPFSGDGAIGAGSYDISVTALGQNGVIAYCYVDFTEGDLDMRLFNNNLSIGSPAAPAVALELDVNTALLPLSNIQDQIECTATNSTNLFVFSYDATSDDDATYHIVSLNITSPSFPYNASMHERLTDADVDAAVGNFGQVATASLNGNSSVMVWYNSSGIRYGIRSANNVVLKGVTDLSKKSGTFSRVSVAAVNNESVRDYFVTAWYNQSSGQLLGAAFDDVGNIVTKHFEIDTAYNPINATALFDIVGEEDASGLSLCPGKWAIVYTNSTNSTVIKTYNLAGDLWDGVCGNPVPPGSPDISPPNVTLLIPANNTNLATGVASFGALFEDDVNLSNATLYIYNSSDNLVAQNFTLLGNSTIFKNIIHNFGLNGTGKYYWNFLASDNASAPNQAFNRSNFTVRYSSSYQINGTIPLAAGGILNTTFAVYNYASNISACNVTSNGSACGAAFGSFSWANITFNNKTEKIKNIEIYGINVTADVNTLMQVDTSPNKTGFDDVFAINPTFDNFTDAHITFTATSSTFLKCTSWNFTSRSCPGTWQIAMSGLTVGNNYTFSMNATDPGYAQINISNATHLDQDYNYISDVYPNVSALDDNWSEIINHSHYVRVTFERNLTSVNDITLYTRSLQNRNMTVWVYPYNSSSKIAEFPILNETDYSQIILTEMNGTNAIFDLRVVDLDNRTDSYLEFDYITDPTYNFTNTFSPDIDMSAVNNETFAVVYTDATCDCVKFTVQNTNGSVRLAPVTVASGVNVNVSRVGIETINDTAFFLAWTTGAGVDNRAGYTIDGSAYLAAVSGDGAIGTVNHDVSLAVFSGVHPLIAYCYVDNTEGDADVRVYNASNGALIGAEVDANTALVPESSLKNILDCAAATNTNATLFGYDAGTDDDTTFHGFATSPAPVATTVADLDNAVGNDAQVAATALNNDRFALAWYDFETDFIRIALRGADNTVILSGSNVHGRVGNNSRVAMATVADRASGGRDNFAVVWYNGTGNYTALSVFNENGTRTLGSLQLGQIDTNLRLVSALGESDSQNRSICPGKFVVAYTNSTNVTVFGTYNLDGTNWDGTCDVAIPSITAISPLNNSGIRHSSTNLNFSVDDPMSNSMYVDVYAGTDQNTTNYDMMLFYGNVSDPTNINYNWSSKPVNRSDPGLFLLYRFDNNPMFGENRSLVKDFSPSGLDGSIQTPTDDRAPYGYFGKALTTFTGTNDIALPDDTITNSPNATGQFTAMFWINLTTTNFTRGFEAIAVKSLSTADRAYGVYVRNSSKSIYASFSNGVIQQAFEASNNSLLQQFVWYHVAVTVDRITENATIYINGQVNSSVLLSTLGGNALMNSTSPLTIGDVRGVNGEPTYIDDLALYNRTLSAQEVLNHYQLGNGTYFWKVNVTNYDGGQNETPVYKFSVDSHPPSVVLSYPSGQSFNSGALISFNWTATDFVDLNMQCNLSILGGVDSANYLNVTNGTMFNKTMNSLTWDVGAHTWNAVCWDDAYNVNTSATGAFTIGASNSAPYNLTQLILNTSNPLALNRTLEDLTISANISDPNGDKMNLTVYWYRNDILASIAHNKGNYSNGTIFYNIVLNTDTFKDDVWKAGVVITDGVANSTQFNSSTLTIRNSPPVITGLNIDTTSTIPRSYENILASGSVEDDDEDTPLTTNFTWIKNNETILYSFQTTTYTHGVEFATEILYEGNTSVWDVIYLNVTIADATDTSEFRDHLFIINSVPYNSTIVRLNSSNGINGTQHDLVINTSLVDLDSNRMNVSVYWFNKSVLHLITQHNSSYVNGTLFNATLGKGNLTSTSTWIAGLVITDFYNISNQVNTTSLSLSDDVAPTVLLQVPSNSSTTSVNQVWFAAQILDDVNVSNATLYIYNTTNGAVDKLIGTNFTGVGNSSRLINISYTLNYTGTFYWNFLAYDNATLVNNNAFNATNWSITKDLYTTISSCGGTYGSNSYLQLLTDLSGSYEEGGCIALIGENIILEGNGKSMTNIGDAAVNEWPALQISNSNNVTIRNINITNLVTCAGDCSALAVSLSTTNNSIIRDSYLGPSYTGIVMASYAYNNNFTNVSVRNATSHDLQYLDSINGTSFIDSYAADYAFGAVGGNIRVIDSRYGQIEFLRPINGSGANFTRDIAVLNNNATVRTDLNIGFNRSANITLYNLPTNFVSPLILRDGLTCPLSSPAICANFTSLNAGNVSFNVTAFTEYRISNTSNSAPYNLSQLIINSSLAGFRNMSIENITLSMNISDPNGDRMNVSIYWYNGSTLAFLEHNKSNYQNGTRMIGFALYTNVTKGEDWKAGVVITDGLANSTQINSSVFEIGNTPPFITNVELPQDGNTTTDRTPYFNWSAYDYDGDVYSLGINITPIRTASPCTDPLYLGTDADIVYQTGSRTFVSLTNSLKCLIDNGYAYNWSIRANDSGNVAQQQQNQVSSFGWQTYRQLRIAAFLSVTAVTSQVNFSTIDFNEWNDTSDDRPLPLVLRNDGNAYTNVSIVGTNLWNTVSNPSAYYQFKIDNVTSTGENASFLASKSSVVYTNVPLSEFVCLVELNYTDSKDSAEIDINVTVPIDESYGPRGSVLTFVGSLGE